MIFLNLFIILTHLIFQIKSISNQTVYLSTQNNDWFKGPENYGVNMGHAAANSNWLKFLKRLNINAARLFVSSISDLRSFIGSKNWGLNLNGIRVTNQNEFISSVNDLRSSFQLNSHLNNKFKNPIKWKELFDGIAKTTQAIRGSDEENIKILTQLNINPLVVLHIGCGKPSVKFEFKSFNLNDREYWSERWELYKLSYALAVWSRSRLIQLVEFYNEPDLFLDECLTSNKFKDYYLIRSLSIHDAYDDLNRLNLNNTKLSVKLAASAFARRTYGGDSKRYLGDICVKNNNLKFGSNVTNSSWSNMELYSYHSYGKQGDDMNRDVSYLRQSIDNDSLFKKQFPMIITEFNTHTAADWDKFNSTGDNDFEASRLASQIINLINSRNNQLNSLFVFKFSIMPSFSKTRDIAKNGLHYGELNEAPFHLSDSLLSAESVRLLSHLQSADVYPLNSNDTSKFRTYLSSKSDNFYYIYAVNDRIQPAQLIIDTSQWNINSENLVLIESVNSNYWGEISQVRSYSKQFEFRLDGFTTSRLTFQIRKQEIIELSPQMMCYASAGSNMNKEFCSTNEIKIATSNNSNHDSTSVGLIRFKLNDRLTASFKAVLELNVKIACETTLMVLGVRNLQLNNSSWKGLASLVKELPNGVLISKISDNFINWSSKLDLMIVGHFNVRVNNETRMIDVSDYVQSVNDASQLKDLSFLIYRPFRHGLFKTSVGVIPSDDLARGCVSSLHADDSILKPNLKIFSSFSSI